MVCSADDLLLAKQERLTIKTPFLTVNELGQVSLRSDLEPEDGTEKAWEYLLKRIAQYNEDQVAACAMAADEALERAADMVGAMADQEGSQRRQEHSDQPERRRDPSAEHEVVHMNMNSAGQLLRICGGVL